MAYNTLIFEKAIHSFGYVIEQIKKNSTDRVLSVYGAIIEGIHVKRVRWDSEGKCFSQKGKALSKYDLPLEEVQSRLKKCELYEKVQMYSYSY